MTAYSPMLDLRLCHIKLEVRLMSDVKVLSKGYPRVSQGLAKLKGAVWTWVEFGLGYGTRWEALC